MLSSSFLSGLLIGLLTLPVVYSLPQVQDRSVDRTVVTSLSTFDKRQEPVTLEWHCSLTGSGGSNAVVTAAADNLAKYLEGVAQSGRNCGLDRSRPYFNMITMNGYEANLYFTGRVPQLQSAEFSCNDMAAEIRKMAQICTQGNSGLVLGYVWLLNCKAISIGGNIPTPYVEGGTGIEFRQVGWPSDTHTG